MCCPVTGLTGSNQGGLTFGSLSPVATPNLNPGFLKPTTYSSGIPNTNVCGISNFTQTRVVGGGPARVGQYPWIAALGYKSSSSTHIQFSCAGSLITLRHVITTAHCISSNL